MKLNLPAMQMITPYMMHGTLLKMLLCHFSNLRKTFSNGFSIMKGNARKCHLILSTDRLLRSLIKSTNCEKLGIKIDSKHTFDEHIETVCKTASNKVKTLARVSYTLHDYRELKKKRF